MTVAGGLIIALGAIIIAWLAARVVTRTIIPERKRPRPFSDWGEWPRIDDDMKHSSGDNA